METNFPDLIVELYKNNLWKEIIELNNNFDKNSAVKLLWVWPSESNLKFIQKYLNKYCVEGVISIGCGSGLLEWILHRFTNLPILGYEVNQEWWQSKYSGPKFIPLEFNVILPTPEIQNTNFALLFCYFNNGPAFREYIKHFKGQLVFIIGAGDGSGRHTNPQPFNPDFGCENYKLLAYQEVKNTKDFIAVYINSTQPAII